MKGYIALLVLVGSVASASASYLSPEAYDECFDEIKKNMDMLVTPDLIPRLEKAVEEYALGPRLIELMGEGTVLDYYAGNMNATETEKQELPEKCILYLKNVNMAMEASESCPALKGSNFIDKATRSSQLREILDKSFACVTIFY